MPREMPTARTIPVSGGRRFEYVERGKGPATLLVHPGGPGLTYHYLRPLLKLASSHLRVVLFNPRGVGGSWKPKRPSAYTIENMAEDVEALRCALDVKELHLLGFSAGGFVALEYIHRYPRNVTSLLLCDTAGSAAEVRQSTRMMLQCATPRQKARVRELTRARAFDTKEYETLFETIFRPFSGRFLAGTPPDLRRTRQTPEVYRAMMTRSGNELVVDGTMARWDGRRYYAKIECPTLVLVGRYDFFLEAAREAADRIVPAHLRVLPRSSHLAHLEQPREFLGAVREFVVDVTGD